MFHSFFSSLTSICLSFFAFFYFNSGVDRNCKIHQMISSFFFLINTRSCLLVGIRWFFSISKSQRIFCVSFSRTDSALCIYYLLVWSNFNRLRISHWITFPKQWCLLLYSFRANLLHPLTMWLTISFLSLHSQYFLFFYVLAIFAFIKLVIMAIML